MDHSVAYVNLYREMDMYSDQEHDDEDDEEADEGSIRRKRNNHDNHGDDFIVKCEGEQFVCKHPKLSKVFHDLIRTGGIYTCEVILPYHVTRIMVEFMNTNEIVNDVDVPIEELGRAAALFKIPTMTNALVPFMRDLICDLSEDELLRFFDIRERTPSEHAELCQECCLWLHGSMY